MSLLTRVIESSEFALIARVCSVAAVLLGTVGAVAAVLANMVFSDLRDDVKATRKMIATISNKVSVHEVQISDHGRRLGLLEPAVFQWRQPTRADATP